MRRLLLSAILATAALAGCEDGAQTDNSHQGPALRLPSGVLDDHGETDIRTILQGKLPAGVKAAFIGQPDQDLLLLELDPHQLEPVLLTSPEDGMAARDALAKYDVQVLIGSGFVAELHSLQPVGLLQVKGNTLNPVQGHGYTRILGINDGGMGVVHKAAYQRDLFHSALQVGPGIVEAGRLDISERDLQRPKYFRSFVAVCKQRWIVGISLRPAHLRTLGQALLRHVHQQGWQCPEVVNLAGDRQAVMLVRTAGAGVVYHGDPDTYKVSMLGFRFKARPAAAGT
jgi:hypothetical protein